MFKYLMIFVAVVFIGLFSASTAQAQSITITNELLTHNDGFIDYYDVDWLTFDVSGNTGGDTMMVRYGVQWPGSTTYVWSRWYIVTGAYNIDGEIACAWNGWVGHNDDYLVCAELRTYSLWTNGDLVVDDVSFFDHN